MKSKIKIILFIVEGLSDTTALSPYLTKIMNTAKHKLTVHITHGDKTSEPVPYDKTTFTVRPGEIEKYLEELIIAYLSKKSTKDLGIKANNIHKVYYVTDTDNCFHETTPPRVNKMQCFSKIINLNTIEVYQNDKIRKQKKQLVKSDRNVHIAQFETIFFSRDLEAITINNTKVLTDDEKK